VAIQDAQPEGTMTKEQVQKLTATLDSAIQRVTALIEARDRRRQRLSESILDDAELVQSLQRSGAGPATMANAISRRVVQRNAEENPALAEYQERMAAGQDYSDSLREAGRRQQEQYLPASVRKARACTDSKGPVRQHEGDDYADIVNAHGRRLRGR
jgi:hypothetical protein